jgi:acyl dehydratase
MPLDVEKALQMEIPGVGFSWTEKDIILYNLAIGAGVPPTDERELGYVYEGELKAIPTFGTIPPFSMMMGLTGADGLDINLTQILHGEHQLRVHRRIPTSATVSQTGRVVDVFDKGKGALVVVEVVSALESTGEPLFTNLAGVYVRGEGGFGGDSGPVARNQPPDSVPDLVVESPTMPQQALLYRQASGDRNPLHADPGFAAFAGYERPILHGLCTYGMVGKAVVDSVLEGDTDRFEGFSARFSGHVFPGETLVTSIWATDEGWVVSASTADRGRPVLSNALVFAA